ncbi:MAG: hypothetical protein H6Q84_2200, partial [Deltaproteobacteria bacterium]|nr:hypothetical protein [Deltaproteobacteria bacterium]
MGRSSTEMAMTPGRIAETGSSVDAR